MNTTNFSYSEEAFLLNSLQEVVKVWASGKGKADFQLKIKNGTAELQLAFRLGHPSDVHVVPPQHYNHQQQPPHDLHHEQQFPHRRRRKGAARREKDRARAEKYQAGLNPEKSAESADILLPIRGRILPLAAHDDQVEATVPVAPTPTPFPPSAPTRASSAASACTPNGAEAAPNQTSAKPKKSFLISSPKYIDYNLVRNNLFPLQEPPNAPLPQVHEDPQSVSSKEFQRKEDVLWARIFST